MGTRKGDNAQQTMAQHNASRFRSRQRTAAKVAQIAAEHEWLMHFNINNEDEESDYNSDGEDRAGEHLSIPQEHILGIATRAHHSDE